MTSCDLAHIFHHEFIPPPLKTLGQRTFAYRHTHDNCVTSIRHHYPTPINKTGHMAKRRLSRRQAWRIEKVQAERIARAGKKSQQVEKQLTEGKLGPEQIGLVIAHYGTQVEIETQGSTAARRIQRAHLRANLDPLVTGDNVVWRPARTNDHGTHDQAIDDGGADIADTQVGVVVARMPRDSELCRPDAHGALKPVAANINRIIITCAPEPRVYAAMLDRFLVAAEHQGIEPILLLNKDDLLTPDNRDGITTMLEQFAAIGYLVIYTSTQRDNGLQNLQRQLAGNTSVFVGQSGVGKSSLINALLPTANIRVGALSASSGKGRHTTTTAKLFHFPNGGELIDSPGVRDFGLWHMSEPEIAQGFRDFAPFLGHCRFRDCAHAQDPGCALHTAVNDGHIHPRRLQSYHHLVAALHNNG